MTTTLKEEDKESKESQEAEVIEIVAKDGSIIKKKKNGQFAKGTNHRAGKRFKRTTLHTIARQFSTADKAIISNLSQKSKLELMEIVGNPNRKAMEIINASLLLRAMNCTTSRALLNKIMGLPETLFIAKTELTQEQMDNDLYRSVMVIPANGREALPKELPKESDDNDQEDNE